MSDSQSEDRGSIPRKATKERNITQKYTYCSTIGNHGFPQTLIVKVEPGDMPNGVPIFDSKEECIEFLRNKDA